MILLICNSYFIAFAICDISNFLLADVTPDINPKKTSLQHAAYVTAF